MHTPHASALSRKGRASPQVQGALGSSGGHPPPASATLGGGCEALPVLVSTPPFTEQTTQRTLVWPHSNLTDPCVTEKGQDPAGVADGPRQPQARLAQDTLLCPRSVLHMPGLFWRRSFTSVCGSNA